MGRPGGVTGSRKQEAGGWDLYAASFWEPRTQLASQNKLRYWTKPVIHDCSHTMGFPGGEGAVTPWHLWVQRSPVEMGCQAF